MVFRMCVLISSNVMGHDPYPLGWQPYQILTQLSSVPLQHHSKGSELGGMRPTGSFTRVLAGTLSCIPQSLPWIEQLRQYENVVCERLAGRPARWEAGLSRKQV